MLTIRLSRTGRKKLAMYRVVAADSKRAVTSKYVALLGNYNPHTKDLVLDTEKVQKYLDSGAQPSSRVIKLLQTQKDIKIPAWALKNLKVKPIKAKEASKAQPSVGAGEAEDSAVEEKTEASATEEVPAEAAETETVAEAPAEETKEEAAEEKPAETPEETKE